MPEAIHHASLAQVMRLFLAGMLLFIVFDRALRWRHPHRTGAGHSHHPALSPATAVMLLWGDALHSFIDGLVLGVAFRIGPEMGWSATLAVFAHEVPQEIADFAVLISSGISRKRAMLLNYVSASTVLPGTALAYAWSPASQQMGWLLPLAAGGFVYIALANLVPALHHRPGALAGSVQVLFVLGGVATIWAALSALPH